jgi:phosphatidate cytidylyltransferase
MLIQRALTAIVMLAILLPALFSESLVPFGLVTMVLVTAGAWEWARLNQYGGSRSFAVAVLSLFILAVSWQVDLASQPLRLLWLLVSALWVIAGVWLLGSGVSAWSAVPKFVRLWSGFFVILAAWIAIMQARREGINFIFSLLVLVWVADVFAYFVGRAFGGKLISRKLAPMISPGKSWEGAMGGLLGVIALSFFWRWADQTFNVDSKSIYTRLFEMQSWLMLVSVVFLGAMSVVGDLLESLFKRSAGVKDSSKLLPGHGGVLDRVDALLPVLPIGMMLLLV